MTVANSAGAALRERISRPELSRRIRDALERGSVLVVADAGFGKTLALEDALEGWRTAVWVACSVADREPGHLIVSILAAMRRALPGAVDVLTERLTVGVGAVDPLLAAREVAAELERLLVDPVALVLDDADRLADSKDAIEVVAELLGPGSRLAVAIASRQDLPLKTAKPRATGRLCVLRSVDLAFSDEECERFLADRLGREPLASEVARAVEMSDGWPLGLELGAASGDVFAIGRASRRSTFEYLGEEVLAAIDPGFREHVLESSVPSELSAPVVESLALPEAFVEQAQRRGLFLRPVGGGRDAYAYHPLFREFLLDELHRHRSESELRRLHALTARGTAAAGRIAESVEHWLSAEDWEGAVAAMAAAHPQLLRTAPGSLRAWLERLPAGWRAEPACLLIEGQLRWSGGENERAIPVLRRAVAALHDAGAVDGEWMARATLGDALFWTGALEEVDAVAEGWDAFEPDEAPLWTAGTALGRAIAYAATGRAEEAEAIIGRLSHEPTAGVLRPLMPIAQAHTATAGGHTDRLLADFRAGIAELEVSDPMGRLTYLLAGTAMVHEQRAEYREALSCWERARAEAMRSGLSYVVNHSHAECASLLGFQGRRREAELALGRAGQVSSTGWRDRSFAKARAVIAGLAGDFGSAAAAAEDALTLVASAPTAFRVDTVVELAPVLEASGSGAVAMSAVNDVLDTVDRQFPGVRGAFARARLIAARAWLLERSGEAEAADEDVSRCFAEGGDSARHVLRREWKRLEEIVWRALARGKLDPDTVVRELAAALPGGAALVSLMWHPELRVRHAAAPTAAASGHPDAIANLQRLTRESDAAVAAAAKSTLARLSHEPPALAFTLLGRFTVTRGTWQADDAAWERRVAQRLVRFLLLHRDRFVSEDELVEVFWPDRDAESARRSLRVAASRARGVLDVPGAPSVIEIAERAYVLHLRAGDTVDADDFQLVVAAALAAEGEARGRLLERAESLWGGEPLPEERYSDWALGWRERLMDLYAALLAAVSDDCLARGDLIGGGRRARQLVDLDPLHEGGHRRLMITHARAGQRSQALRQFLECRRALVEQLGVEPASDTARLQQRILAGEPV